MCVDHQLHGHRAHPEEARAAFDRLTRRELARSLGEVVASFRTRPLDAGPYTYLWLDAVTQRVREGSRAARTHPAVPAPQMTTRTTRRSAGPRPPPGSAR